MIRFSLPLALMLLAAPASAQNINIQAGPNGFSMQADVPPDQMAGSATVTTSSSSTFSSSEDGYRLSYESNADGSTLMRVLSPEGAQVQVWDGKKMIAEDDVPMSFNAQGDKFYRLVIKLANGMLWEKKLSAKRGQTASLWVAAPTVNAQVVVNQPAPQPQPQPQVIVHEIHHVQAPPPQPVPAGPMPMSDADFAALRNAIQAEDFSNEKLSVLQTAAGAAWFTINQVGQIVDLFDFGNDKVAAVRTVKDHIVDRQNAFQLYSHFDFSSEKAQVKQLLGQ